MSDAAKKMTMRSRSAQKSVFHSGIEIINNSADFDAFRNHNPRVGGSSPSPATKLKSIKLNVIKGSTSKPLVVGRPASGRSFSSIFPCFDKIDAPVMQSNSLYLDHDLNQSSSNISALSLSKISVFHKSRKSKSYTSKNSPWGVIIMDYIEIKILKFSALVKRNDIKSPQWFAMPNEVLEHPDFFDITGDEFKAFSWICGVASKLNSEVIRVYPDLCARRLNIPREAVAATVRKLNGKRWDVTDALRAAERVSYATEQNSTEQNIAAAPTPKISADVFENKYFRRIAPDTKALILRTYPQEFVAQTILDACAYLDSNHHRHINREDTFLTSKLKRDWEYKLQKAPKEAQIQNKARNQSLVLKAQTEAFIADHDSKEWGTLSPEEIKAKLPQIFGGPVARETTYEEKFKQAEILASQIKKSEEGA